MGTDDGKQLTTVCWPHGSDAIHALKPQLQQKDHVDIGEWIVVAGSAIWQASCSGFKLLDPSPVLLPTPNIHENVIMESTICAFASSLEYAVSVAIFKHRLLQGRGNCASKLCRNAKEQILNDHEIPRDVRSDKLSMTDPSYKCYSTIPAQSEERPKSIW
jgi:hypothetical protein